MHQELPDATYHESVTFKIAHDYVCPWCWIAVSQTRRLSERFGVEFDWVGYELFPENLPLPPYVPPPIKNPDRPETPRRIELAYAAEGMLKPTAARPRDMRSHNALEATEFMKSIGKQDEFIEAMYRAHWEEAKVIDDLDVICSIAAAFTDQLDELRSAVEEKKFDHLIVKFDNEAYAAGVYNVPTYFIGDQRLAEQPSIVLAHAIGEYLRKHPNG